MLFGNENHKKTHHPPKLKVPARDGKMLMRQDPCVSADLN